MEFKISGGGTLDIKRGNNWKHQDCPFNIDCVCGDWCPLFGEPALRDDYFRPGYGWVDEADGQVELSLCQRNLEGHLTDEREGGWDPVAAMEQWKIAKAEGKAAKAQKNERPDGAEGETE